VAVIENKKANIKATHAIEQIENCFMLARRLLAPHARHYKIVYRLAIYAQGGWFKSDIEKIEARNRKKYQEPPIRRRKYDMNILTLFEGAKK